MNQSNVVYLQKCKEIERLMLGREYGQALSLVKSCLREEKQMPHEFWKKFSDLFLNINYKIYCANRAKQDITEPLITRLKNALSDQNISRQQLLSLCAEADIIDVTKIIVEIKVFLKDNHADNICKTWLIHALCAWNYQDKLTMVKNNQTYLIDLKKGFTLFDSKGSLTLAWNALANYFFSDFQFIEESYLKNYAMCSKTLQSFYLHTFPDIPLPKDVQPVAAAVLCFTLNNLKQTYNLTDIIKKFGTVKKAVLFWLKRIESVYWS